MGPQPLTVQLEKDLTLWTVAEVKQTLQQALAEDGDLELDLGAVREVDAAGLQLLCSVHRSALAAERRLCVVNSSDAVASAAERAGLWRTQGCTAGCLWVRNEDA